MKKVISVSDYGIKPNNRCDSTPHVLRILEDIRGTWENLIVFPKGKYHFWPERAYEKLYCVSNHDEDAIKSCGFPLIDFSELIIDGQGSEFIFHGKMIPFVVEKSKNIIIKNLSIDWQRPMHSQGIVKGCSSDTIELMMGYEFPFKVENEKLVLLGEGWEEEPWAFMEFDTQTGKPAYQSGDDCVGFDVRRIQYVQCENGNILLKGNFTRYPAIGNTLVLRHGERSNPGIYVLDSSKIILEGIDIYHAGGMGVICQKSEDMKLDHVNICLKENGDRYFSTYADATHFACCRGKIEIKNCLFENQMDDAINIHGIYFEVIERISDRSLLVKLMHPQHKGVRVVEKGDFIGFVHKNTLLTQHKCTAASVKYVNIDFCEVTFTEQIPEIFSNGYVLENLSWIPDASVKNCVVRSNRARGMLISTAGLVEVDSCYFSVPGAAIKISGDANNWYESGAVENISIINNKFEDCNYCFGAWGKCVIDIDPEIDEYDTKQGYYHRGISIEDNEFSTFSNGIIWAQSVDGLKFCNNRITMTSTYPQNTSNQNRFEVKHCTNINIIASGT